MRAPRFPARLSRTTTRDLCAALADGIRPSCRLLRSLRSPAFHCASSGCSVRLLRRSPRSEADGFRADAINSRPGRRGGLLSARSRVPCAMRSIPRKLAAAFSRTQSARKGSSVGEGDECRHRECVRSLRGDRRFSKRASRREAKRRVGLRRVRSASSRRRYSSPDRPHQSLNAAV